MSLREEIEKLAPGLRRFARALVQHSPDEPHEVADELVHETIVRAMRIERNWRITNAKIWLYATLTNLNRARLRLHNSLGRGWRGQAPAQDGGATQAGARAQGISHALDALPVEEREALLLVVLEGFSYGQAADVLGVPRSALAARVTRARHFLTEHLDAALPIEARNRAKHPEYLRLVK